MRPVAVVGLIVDLGAADAARNPGVLDRKMSQLRALTLPRLAVAPTKAALPLVLAGLPIPQWGN